ncbi:ABC-three component system protein [Facklamia sp. P13055]|uniref:ABC-three component system protein n=1 Tax=Facklamia sp. P13055 TaxID=3421952 RepID=UPI003D1822F2
MCKHNSNFKPVKAYGRLGDRKNDGFDKTTGTIYQVFAPEDLNREGTIKDGVRKLKEDFKGLYEKWNDICPIKKYYFVANDKYDGVPAPIHDMAIELSKQSSYSHIDIDILGASDLEKIFNSLDRFEKQDIVGFIPDQNIQVVEYEALNETVNYLLTIENNINYLDKLIVPDFYEKITFNGLSQVVRNKLTVGSYQEGILIEYFNNTPGVNEVLQKKFHMLYEEAKNIIKNTKENFADCRFYYILEKSCIKNTIPIQTSVLVLMSYYFSSCDVFEEPS